MVKLKLKRLGAPHKPSYRIVVMDSKKSPGSDYIEAVGTYRPLESDETKQITFEEEKVLSWLAKGAQPTEKTLALLKKTKLWKKYIDSKNHKEA